MDLSTYLTRARVVELLTELGQPVKAGSWSGMVTRRQAPPPDARIGRTPLWKRETVTEWAAQRPGRGARTDLTLKGPRS